MTTFSTPLLTKSFFLCCALCAAFCLQAKTYTVSNNPETPGQFTAVSTAIAAAAAGDTLLIQGSPINYGDIEINKTLTLIGPGHHPQKQNPLTATFTNISVAAKNIKLFGLVVNRSVQSRGGVNADSLTISYCRVLYDIDTYSNRREIYGGNTSSNDWIIRNNIVENISNQPSNALLIHNNIITAHIAFCTQSVSIKNNLFIRNGITQPSIYNAPTGGTIANNIFYNVGLSTTGNYSGTTYQNNITYVPNGSFVFPRGSNIVENNLENTNPLFVNVPANATTFSYDHNYRLQATSLGRNAGFDGADIGIYGLLPFSKTGEFPQHPVIRTLSILNPNVPSGGALRVSATISRATTGN